MDDTPKVLVVDDDYSEAASEAVELLKEQGITAEIAEPGFNPGQPANEIWPTPFNKEVEYRPSSDCDCDGSHPCGDKCKCGPLTPEEQLQKTLEGHEYAGKTLDQIVAMSKGTTRLEDEDYQTFKIRRMIEGKALKYYLRQGKLVWDSKTKGPVNASLL